MYADCQILSYLSNTKCMYSYDCIEGLYEWFFCICGCFCTHSCLLFKYLQMFQCLFVCASFFVYKSVRMYMCVCLRVYLGLLMLHVHCSLRVFINFESGYFTVRAFMCLQVCAFFLEVRLYVHVHLQALAVSLCFLLFYRLIVHLRLSVNVCGRIVGCAFEYLVLSASLTACFCAPFSAFLPLRYIACVYMRFLTGQCVSWVRS